MAALSRSGQSSNTMCGDFPPHSSQTRLRLDWPEYSMNRFPVAVDPVNVRQSTSLCRPNAWPATGPVPGTTLNTPAGMPASSINELSLSSDSGVSSEGLTTTQLPDTSAGAIFQDAINNG